MSQRTLLFVGALVLAAIVLCTVVVVKADAAATPELTAQKTENRWVKRLNEQYNTGVAVPVVAKARPGLPNCKPRKHKTGYRCNLWADIYDEAGDHQLYVCHADTVIVPRTYSSGYRSKGVKAEGCTL